MSNPPPISVSGLSGGGGVSAENENYMMLSLDAVKEENFLIKEECKSPPSSASNPPNKKFWPEKPPEKVKANTVLTNLQRGNIPTMQTIVEQESITSLHQKAGMGELRPEDITDANLVDHHGGKTLLHWAAAFGQTPTVQLLLRHGADVHRRGREDETSLHLSSCNGHHDTIRLLLSHGAEVDSLDENACTPLMFASMMNHPHSVNELILNNADVTLTNVNGDTAYSLCVERKANLARPVLENHLINLLKGHHK